MHILIDNGHGIDTVGKRSPLWSDGSQLLEWEFNRDIAKRFAKLLSKANIGNTLIVTEKSDIPLPERVKRVNDFYKYNPDSFLVSLHANAGGGTGWEVFTSKGETKSDRISEYFVQSAEKYLPQFTIRKDMLDGDSDKEANFYILKHTLCPAILTENLFMDTYINCKFLLSDIGRDTIAQLHFEAVQNILMKKIVV